MPTFRPLFSVLCALCISAVSSAQTPAPVVTSVELTTFTTDDPTAVALPQTQVPVLTVRGTNFFPSSPGPLVTIRRAGFPDMQRIAGNVNGGDASNGWIEVRNVDLSAYPPGSFDVVVTRAPSNAGSHTLANAFSLLPHGPDRLESRGAWGGPINQLHVDGDLLYIGSGRRLVVLDASDESNLVEVGAIDLKATVLDFEVRDGYAIVATFEHTTNQLCVVDLADPANPALVWNSRHVVLNCAGWCASTKLAPLSVELAGDIAYVTDQAGILHRFDVSDMSSPQYLGVVWSGGTPGIAHVVAEGDRLYGIRNWPHDVRVYELASSGPLPHIGTVPIPIPEGERGRLWQAQGNLVLTSRSIYDWQTVTFNEAVAIHDVSNPASPVLVRTVTAVFPGTEYRRWTGAAMLPGLLLIAEDEVEPRPTDNARGLLVYDTSVNPPVLRSTLKTAGSLYGVKAVGNRAYLFDRGEGLIVVDISNPNQPVRLGSYHSPAVLRNMVKNGDLLYVSDEWTGFTILNVADPARPTVVGVYRTPTGPNTQGSAGLVLHGSLVYLAAGFGGVDIVDVSDPSQPVRVGNIPVSPVGTSVQGIELDRDFLGRHILRIGRYVRQSGPCNGVGLYLRNYDVSIPLHPVLLGEVFVECENTAKIQTVADITRVRLSGFGWSTGSASFQGDRIATLDCTNPAAPVLLSTTSLLAGIADFTIAGDRLYTCEDTDSTSSSDYALVIRDAMSPTNTPHGAFNVSATSADIFGTVAAHAGNVYATASLSRLTGSEQLSGLHLFKPTTSPPGLRLTACLWSERVAGSMDGELLATSGWVYATHGGSVSADVFGLTPAYMAHGLAIIEHVMPPAPPSCPGDTNGDNLVNAADLSVLLGTFGGGVPPGSGADFNGDGLVNAADLSVLLAAFGSSCP